jgi:DnaJ family protein C protein 7
MDFLQAAGNCAFLEGRHADAIEHYTAALACNGESRPYSAVCFCNRAAASQAMGQIADAIADCSQAIVLDPKYPKVCMLRTSIEINVTI